MAVIEILENNYRGYSCFKCNIWIPKRTTHIVNYYGGWGCHHYCYSCFKKQFNELEVKLNIKTENKTELGKKNNIKEYNELDIIEYDSKNEFKTDSDTNDELIKIGGKFYIKK